MDINNNYILIQGWMVSELNLKGNELLIYAIIYGFSQDGDSEFKGSRSYLATWLNTSLQTVDNCINSLIEKGYIEKDQEIINNIKFNKYKIIWGVVKKFGGYPKILGGTQKILHNNIIYNTNSKYNTNSICSINSKYSINNNKKNIKKEKEINKEKEKKFIKPTIEEIQNYCNDRNNNINANNFYDFYESKGWMVGKNKMKDWKACIRTWEQRNNKTTNKKIIPEWYNKEITSTETVDNKEFDNFIKEFRDG